MEASTAVTVLGFALVAVGLYATYLRFKLRQVQTAFGIGLAILFPDDLAGAEEFLDVVKGIMDPNKENTK